MRWTSQTSVEYMDKSSSEHLKDSHKRSFNWKNTRGKETVAKHPSTIQRLNTFNFNNMLPLLHAELHFYIPNITFIVFICEIIYD